MTVPLQVYYQHKLLHSAGSQGDRDTSMNLSGFDSKNPLHSYGFLEHTHLYLKI